MPQFKVNSETLIPLGSALTLATVFFKAWLFVSEQTNRISNLERQVAVGNRWTCSDHQRFLLELQVANPKLVIPPMPKVCGEQ